uniref:CEP63/Deup1 CEP152 binding coiled coil domain-containing protein n=1 Tax=Dromaius novaehollandiae TaxID=8790 RepID=A0A8C4PD51_DRONO
QGDFLNNMEAGFSEMRNELQSRDPLWRGIQLECQQLHTELLKIRQHKDMHQSSCVQLTEQLENKNAELLLLAQSQESQQEELNKIRDHLYQEEQSHCSEQDRMRTEISDLTEELHQKEITIATIMEKASLLERQLKMELEIKDKLLAKQQVCKYKAIKCENTHLKDMMENQECKRYMSRDLSNKKHGSYTAPIHKLEHENVRLRNSLIKLRNNTETSILDNKKMFMPQWNPHLTISYDDHPKKFLQEEEKHTKEFEERLNSHIEELQRHSENTLRKYASLKQNRHI